MFRNQLDIKQNNTIVGIFLFGKKKKLALLLAKRF